ncbi:MAG: hypothetical protein S4CHLAM123_03450 [Chlamydiales bacterium]|nr:hypothetical protein [Chlamydiales bacterium]
MTLKKLLIVPAILTMLFSANLTASGYYGNCYQNDDCCDCLCSGWGLYVDYLYWSPRRCQLDYATTARLNGSAIDGLEGELYSVMPCYDSGYRVGLYKECDCFFFDAFYTSYCTTQSDSVASENSDILGTRFATVFGGVAPPTTAGFLEACGKWELDYDVVDVLAGYNLNSCGCFKSYVFGGFKYASIGQELKSVYRADPAFGVAVPTEDFNPTIYNAFAVKQKADMDAYGVAFGLGAKYTLCGCFDFFGRFSYDVMLGNYDRKYIQLTAPPQDIFTQQSHLDDNCWAPVNCVNLAFGLTYNYDFCGCWINTIGLSVGYEFHQWLNLLDFIDIGALTALPSPVIIDRHLQNFGLDGLTVRLAIGF